MEFVAKDTSVPGVPQLPKDGEGDSGPNVDVEAHQRTSSPNEVDGVRWRQSQEGPDLCRVWAEYGEVRRVPS